VAVDRDAALGFLEPLRVCINRLELAFAVAAGQLNRAVEEDEIADLSAIQLLRHECKMASGAAASAVNVGEHLDEVPLSRTALSEGRIGFAHLNLISYSAAFIGEGFEEARLLRKAELHNVTTFARICRRVRQEARPALCEQEERELHDARFLELSTRDEDGAVWFRGLLDKEGGAYFRTAIEALAQPLPDDHRQAGQRRADALVEIAKVTLDEGRVPERGTVRPHVQIMATLETLLGQPGAAPAELEGSGPISVEMLRRMAGDCSLRRLLLDESSLVIDVGRERRIYRGATRVALENRDRGCVWPGCTRPARFCQADHANPWYAGGETNVSEGRLLCRYHHRLREEGWDLTKIIENGEPRWVVTPPRWSYYEAGSA
jgi:hypothetical protein